MMHFSKIYTLPQPALLHLHAERSHGHTPHLLVLLLPLLLLPMGICLVPDLLEDAGPRKAGVCAAWASG